MPHPAGMEQGWSEAVDRLRDRLAQELGENYDSCIVDYSGVLALLFLFAGGTNLVLPAAEMTKQMPMLSGSFLRLVGVFEVLGGIGIILPGCLVVIMIGATVVTLMTGGDATPRFPFATGLLLVFVAYGLWRRASHRAAVNA